MEKLEKDPRFFSWINNPTFETVARRLIEGEIAIYRAVLFNKAARGGTVLPFHQDGGATGAWIATRRCRSGRRSTIARRDAGCVEVVPGSHKEGLATPLGGLIPDDIVRARAFDENANGDARIVPLPAAAGEVILIHNHLWHRSGVNRTERPRRAFTVCYMSAATRCLRRKRAPRQFVRVFGARETGDP